MAAETRVDVFDGKYTVIMGDDGSSRALRYGEPWPAYGDGPVNNLERALATELAELRDAVEALYKAGRWSCDRPVDEAALWEALRDAAGIAPGTATGAGVADTPATNLCPYCADKPDCDCEPPLPFIDRPGAEL